METQRLHETSVPYLEIVRKSRSVNARTTSRQKSLLIVNCSPLDRECLTQALEGRHLGLDLPNCASMAQWRSIQDQHPPLGAVLYHLGNRKVTETEEAEKIITLTAELGKIPIVILADTDDLAQVLKALAIGARGYILTSVDISVCVNALNLAVAGGIFIPASSVLAVKHLVEAGRPETRDLSDVFTPRQAEVINALRKGKANKAIAHELHLRESTVKVHIRNIMRKLKATNRTEAVFKVRDSFSLDADTGGVMLQSPGFRDKHGKCLRRRRDSHSRNLNLVEDSIC